MTLSDLIDILGWLLLIPAAGVLLLALVFGVEVILAALLGPGRGPGGDTTRASSRPGPARGERSGSFAVLIPAHNEQAVLAGTLSGVTDQLGPDDRALVVADNCSDQTAAIARGAGVLVLERTDTVRRGKGFALDAGIRELERLVDAGQMPEPAVLVIVDADCRLGERSLDRLRDAVLGTGDPAQAVYLMDPPPDAGPTDRVSALAFCFKNQVRPIGLARMGGPCLLTGTGMAMTWDQARAARLASGNIVEDMQLGLDLAIDGHPPRVCPGAMVFSDLPGDEQAKRTQRTRWEHGHLSSLTRHALPMFARGVARGRADLVLLAFELAVPPLSLLVLLTLALAGLTGVVALLGGPIGPLVVAGGAAAAVLGPFLLGWARYGRRIVPPRELFSIGAYVVAKVPLYVAAAIKRQTSWVRTKRDAE